MISVITELMGLLEQVQAELGKRRQAVDSARKDLNAFEDEYHTRMTSEQWKRLLVGESERVRYVWDEKLKQLYEQLLHARTAEQKAAEDADAVLRAMELYQARQKEMQDGCEPVGKRMGE